MPVKRGRLNKEERQYVETKVREGVAAEEIAKSLNRNVSLIAEFIKLNIPIEGTTPSEQEQATQVVIRQELRNSLAWQALKEEFTTEELKYFEEQFILLMAQFREDVLASERTQVFQAIKFEILMSRNLKERRRAREDIDRLERMQAEIIKGAGGDPANLSDTERDQVLSIETQLAGSRAAEQSRTNEYVKLQERHEALMKALKAIRDQRLKAVENKVGFLDVIKELQNRDAQELRGREMELTKLAGQREYVRLGRPHKYEDGNEDSPILSCETVDLGPEDAADAGEEEQEE